MKTNLKKGFTLVEMLIVVVIIGILAAAILPRLTGAQAATRDVAREKGLSDISTALELYTTTQGKYPDIGNTSNASSLTAPLVTERNYIKDIPADPQKSSPAINLGGKTGAAGQFSYIPLSRNGTPQSAYALVAKVETIDKANASAAMVQAIGAAALSDYDKALASLCTSAKNGAATTAKGTDGSCALAKNDMYMVVIR